MSGSEPLDPGSRVVRCDDGCALWTCVRGSGRPIVLCHGGPGLWDALEGLSALIETQLRVHRWDQRGGGRSERRGPYSIDRFVADLEAVRVAFGLERCLVGGHSWGARLALEYALAYPERTQAVLYLNGTGIEWARWSPEYHANADLRRTPAERRRLEALADRERTPEEEQEFLELAWSADFADRPTARARARAILSGGFAVSYACNRALNDEVRQRDGAGMERRCAGLERPVLVVHGALDPRPTAALDSLVRALPRVERVCLPDVAHYPWLEAAEALASTLHGFLADLVD